MTTFLGWCYRWAFHAKDDAGRELTPSVMVPCVEVGGRVVCLACAAEGK